MSSFEMLGETHEMSTFPEIAGISITNNTKPNVFIPLTKFIYFLKFTFNHLEVTIQDSEIIIIFLSTP